MQSVIREMVEEGVRAGICQYEESRAERGKEKERKRSGNKTGKGIEVPNLSQFPTVGQTPNVPGRNDVVKLVKSPSDTTLYKPALVRSGECTGTDMVNHISNFVENI